MDPLSARFPVSLFGNTPTIGTSRRGRVSDDVALLGSFEVFLLHELKDYKADLAAGVATYVVNVGDRGPSAP